MGIVLYCFPNLLSQLRNPFIRSPFPKRRYRIIDDGGSVQAATLNKLKRDTFREILGCCVRINEGAELTWMRQPHYYMGLYPYTYSAGLTIATEVSKRALNEGQKALDDWKEVLKAGGTKTPIELAQMAGVDITTGEAFTKYNRSYWKPNR